MKKQIFVAHPHPVVCMSLEYLINDKKDLHVCGTSRDYNSTLNSIRELRPDLAVVDIFMNNQYKCIVADVKKENSSLPVLVVSHIDESLYVQRCIRMGASGYITLDKSENEILTALRMTLIGEKYFSERELQKVLSSYRFRGSISFGDPIDELSEREFEVYNLVGQGLKTKKIAETMGISYRTVDAYYEKIKKKLNFVNIIEMRRSASFFL
jgi:DNA-binding NarL/FixJ family response regulator